MKIQKRFIKNYQISIQICSKKQIIIKFLIYSTRVFIMKNRNENLIKKVKNYSIKKKKYF